MLDREHDASDSILKTVSAASSAIVGATLTAANAPGRVGGAAPTPNFTVKQM